MKTLASVGIAPTKARGVRFFGKNHHWILVDGVLRLFPCIELYPVGKCLDCGSRNEGSA